MAPRPFTLWRQAPNGPPEVVARGTVAADGVLAVTEMAPPFAAPQPDDPPITLAELTATAERASSQHLRLWIEAPEADPEPEG